MMVNCGPKPVEDLSEVRMLSSADMARIFNMTPNSVWHAARAGRLPKPVEIGERGRRWLEADIRDFINRQRGAS